MFFPKHHYTLRTILQLVSAWLYILIPPVIYFEGEVNIAIHSTCVHSLFEGVYDNFILHTLLSQTASHQQRSKIIATDVLD